MKKGYSLVEMMVVVGLLTLIGVGIVAMFLATARGGGKTGAEAKIKEEGDYAVTTMERIIRYAKSVSSCNGGSDTITVNLVDGTSETFSLSGSQLMRGGNSLTSNEVIVTHTPSHPSIFTCTAGTGNLGNQVDIWFTVSNNAEQISEDFASGIVMRNANP